MTTAAWDSRETVLQILRGKGVREGSQTQSPTFPYRFLCCFTDHRTPDYSLGVTADAQGFHCAACGIGGKGVRKFRELMKEGLREANLPTTVAIKAKREPLQGCTVSQVAKAKGLSQDFLVNRLGWMDTNYFGVPAVLTPYYDEAGLNAVKRYRVGLNTGRRFAWATGAKLRMYGLQFLKQIQAKGYVILLEGETNAISCWQNGIPALGIPGKDAWRAEWAGLLEGLKVFVWPDPDDTHNVLVRKINASLPVAGVIHSPEGVKAANDLMAAAPMSFPVAVQRLIAESTPYIPAPAARNTPTRILFASTTTDAGPPPSSDDDWDLLLGQHQNDKPCECQDECVCGRSIPDDDRPRTIRRKEVSYKSRQEAEGTPRKPSSGDLATLFNRVAKSPDRTWESLPLGIPSVMPLIFAELQGRWGTSKEILLSMLERLIGEELQEKTRNAMDKAYWKLSGCGHRTSNTCLEHGDRRDGHRTCKGSFHAACWSDTANKVANADALPDMPSPGCWREVWFEVPVFLNPQANWYLDHSDLIRAANDKWEALISKVSGRKGVKGNLTHRAGCLYAAERGWIHFKLGICEQTEGQFADLIAEIAEEMGADRGIQKTYHSGEMFMVQIMEDFAFTLLGVENENSDYFAGWWFGMRGSHVCQPLGLLRPLMAAVEKPTAVVCDVIDDDGKKCEMRLAPRTWFPEEMAHAIPLEVRREMWRTRPGRVTKPIPK